VGLDRPLRDTYAILFNRAGYWPETADFQDALRLVALNAAALVIDHTLSKEQRGWLINSVRNVSSSIRILVLHSAAKDSGADLAMDSRLGPDAILENVALLIARRKPIWVWMESIKSMLRFGGSVKAG